MGRLFAEFTGLRFHIAWASSPLHDLSSMSLLADCATCRRLARTAVGNQRYCRTCGSKHLARALSANGPGHYFHCPLGVRNYWLPIRVRGLTLGVAYLRALDSYGLRQYGVSGSLAVRPRALDHSVFRRAGRLLRFIIQHLQTLDLAELRKAELTTTRHTILALEREQARLRQALRHHPQSPAPVIRSSRPESHSERVVREMLDHIERDYPRPITLQQCASQLGMNAAYLSDLFSRAVGAPFKSYLTELRLEKARRLLCDPSRTVSEVAGAVGYASDRRFRVAFRKATGLSPGTWRRTFRATGQTPLAPSLPTPLGSWSLWERSHR